MTMLETFLKPMHKEGYKFVGAFAVATLLLFWLWAPLGWIGVGLTVWCYYFFRDPKRAVPQGEGLMVSPADGVVSLIERAVPPPELGMGPEPLLRVSVFMSVFNCHVNRAPIAGRLVKMAYRPGKFLNASLDKASVDNERNSLCLELADGRQIAVVQIAGLVARRILPFVTEGQGLKTGERFGLIRFGSRVDVYLPEGVAPLVALGQNMVAGETVMAELGRDLPQRLAKMV
ncbi:MAG: phosphatidylserine decarboxylase [Rhodobacteraceae bacterium GWE1_64_9]|nr:phosphatidylserine decarboxylase [Gemmobacter sp.]OHC43831.1 MAG: phosphatidylserine decarboxylase [Rhodobacteraceae bacterium GWE1_64_9]OHC49518.1 MAG: phosphatidylserine decarboxylase [Rhodobacteraceae bacterium GWF1_65_7]HBU14876.1 phosphatidylserine decarboxylase family protein [Gemmobacter sp.]